MPWGEWSKRPPGACAVSGEGLGINFHVLTMPTRAYSQFCPRDDSQLQQCHCKIRVSHEVTVLLSHSNRALFHAINPSATGRSETGQGYDVVTPPARSITVLLLYNRAQFICIIKLIPRQLFSRIPVPRSQEGLGLA